MAILTLIAGFAAGVYYSPKVMAMYAKIKGKL